MFEKGSSGDRMSRSAFARQFREIVGTPPMEHLTWWRMHEAGIILASDPPVPAANIVTALGYRSDAS